jgi:hypothetical protein
MTGLSMSLNIFHECFRLKRCWNGWNNEIIDMRFYYFVVYMRVDIISDEKTSWDSENSIAVH